MSLPNSRSQREYEKFVADTNDDTAIRVVVKGSTTAPTETEITDGDLSDNAYTLNHGLGYQPNIWVRNNNDEKIGAAQITISKVDANNSKIDFHESITGTYTVCYN